MVTLDAMHCQKETAKAIIDADADYILTVKGNQGNLSRRLLELFIGYNDLNNQVPGLRRHVTVETSHGRKERREYWVIDVPDEAIFKQWEGIASIGMVYRQRETGTGITEEPTYFISSLAPTVKKISRHLRSHWGIENSEHYVLDVTFSEDASRIRKGKLARNFGCNSSNGTEYFARGHYPQ